jgi:Tannase and feruloyl esterase
MRTAAFALFLAVPAILGNAAVARADATCTASLSGRITGDVVVPGGASCTLSNATVTGNVRVSRNAALTVDATAQPTTIGGNVEAIGCASAILEGGVTVTGSVQISQCSQQSGFIGPGVKIAGNFQCLSNAGGCVADMGAVQGSVQIERSSSSDISLVSVGGNLQCAGNSPAPTHNFGPDFVAGSLQGQCVARLGFAPSTMAPSCVASTLNVPNVTVTSATLVPASTVTLPAGTFDVPEHCQVIGAVATTGECPATGPWATGCETGAPGSAEFRLNLPPVWNHHFLFEGCGGNCGSVTSTSVNPVDAAEALGLGYAVVNTDTGHEQDPATILLTWAVSDSTPPVVNAPAIIDFYYRAVHQVTVAAKQYVEAYYSGPIDYAYFDGCSTGGRQSMVEGTHYPVDYDGLIVGDPAIAASYGGTSTVKQALAFVPTGAWIPYPSTAFPTNPNTVAAVDAAVTASCDAVDGVMDGLIQNPAACNILPSALGASGSGILTTVQTNALQAYILPVTDATLGQPLFPGMPISDISTSGFEGNSETTFAPPFPTAAEPWGAATCPYATCGGLGPAAWSLGEVAIKAYVEENQFFNVNPNGPAPSWPETVSATGNTIPVETAALLVAQRGQGGAEDPHQLMNFLNKGGKVIWYHGGSDPLITPFRSTWFYEQLASLLGGYGPTQNSVRLFIEPGMGHCGGGASPNSFDTLQALDYWVTKGVAPEGIIATAPTTTLPSAGRTMPLCKFPEEASYSGSGNVYSAANWSCNPDDRRMLEVGATGLASGADTSTALEYLYGPLGLNGQ